MIEMSSASIDINGIPYKEAIINDGKSCSPGLQVLEAKEGYCCSQY